MFNINVVFIAVSIINLYGASDDGIYADLFTLDEYETIKNKRIRREIRDISDAQWDKIAAAMNIMKNVSTPAGQAIYGAHYFCYDDLVCQHARTNFHSDGDMGHIGPHFSIWHRAFTLSFENILLSIDPEIEGIPYWDFRIDINSHNDIADSVIFSDKYFGAYSTLSGTNNGDYAVKNGKFAYWKVNDNPSALHFECTERYQNAFGLLRQRDNIESSPFVTRYGGNVCGADDFMIGDVALYEHCLQNMTDYNAFFGCFNFGIHARAHIGVGGTRLAFANQTEVPFPGCFAWHAGTWTKEVGNIRKWAQEYGCFDCPLPGDCVHGFDDEFACAMCDLSGRVDDDQKCLYDGGVNITLTIPSEREYQQVIGDFIDQSTSPNDPLFMFHHINMDRYLMEWQIRNYEQSPYYNYPTEGFQAGINLDDVIAPEAPFTNLLFEVDGIGDGPYTVRDVWDGTKILDASYSYDTVLDLIHQSDDGDESAAISMYLYVNYLFFAYFVLLFVR